MTVAADARQVAARALKRSRQRRVWDAQMHPRMAYVSPLPPAPTGIATYSAAVLQGLRRIGFTERHRMDVVWPIEPKHEGLVPWYRLGIYHLGNNVAFHRDVYRFACQVPGLIVLHDLAIDDIVGRIEIDRSRGFPVTAESQRTGERHRGHSRSPRHAGEPCAALRSADEQDNSKPGTRNPELSSLTASLSSGRSANRLREPPPFRQAG